MLLLHLLVLTQRLVGLGDARKIIVIGFDFLSEGFSLVRMMLEHDFPIRPTNVVFRGVDADIYINN